MTAAIDISHLVFVDFIRNIVETNGVKVAKGNLMRIAINIGKRVEKKDFPTFEDFVMAIDADDNPLSRLEGKAVHFGGGLFGLSRCPFGQLISNYHDFFASDPSEFTQLTEEFNAESKMASDCKVGLGAGVGLFCIIHQPMRSQVGVNLTIGGKPIEIFQLACRSVSGKLACADALISEFGCVKADVEKVMENNICCYGIRMKDGSAAC